jgi:hypothetical protein
MLRPPANIVREQGFEELLAALNWSEGRLADLDYAVRNPHERRFLASRREGKKMRPDTWRVCPKYGYRALAQVRDNVWTWYWIGTHAEYDKLF